MGLRQWNLTGSAYVCSGRARRELGEESIERFLQSGRGSDERSHVGGVAGAGGLQSSGTSG